MTPFPNPAKPKRGRPPAAEAVGGVREALLDGARKYFSTRGFKEASLREIAAAAGVNPAMVRYYFGNKEGLYLAMLTETVGPVLARLQDLRAEGSAGLQRFVEEYAKTLREAPWIPNLLVREVLFHDGVVRDRFLSEIASRGGGALSGLFSRDREAGRLPAWLDPQLASLALISMTVFPFIAAPALERVFGLRLEGDFAERLAGHTVALLYGHDEAAAAADVTVNEKG